MRAEQPRLISHEFTTLVMGEGWDALRSGRARFALERDVLPGFILERRWFGDKGWRMPTTRVHSAIPLEQDGTGALLTLIGVTAEGSAEARYLIPLTIRWTRFDRIGEETKHAAAAVRKGPREGTLLDAGADRDFNAQLLKQIHAGTDVVQGEQRIEFRATEAFRQMPVPTIEKLMPVEGEQSNTTAIADANYVVKLIRRLNAGVHPEIEIGRFLIEAGFKQAPDLLGYAELVEGDQRTAIAVVHRFVENQGDAWKVTGAYLDRFIDEQRVLSGETAEESLELAAYLQRVRLLGQRTAELQRTLASRPDLPDFAPEPIVEQDITSWTERLLERSNHTFDLLGRRQGELSETEPLIARVLERREAIVEHIRRSLGPKIDAKKIRHHGDFHLGQVLIVKDDAFILDFEGEPRRPLAERRRKAPAARDVAGLIRSIDYSTTSALLRATTLTSEERALLTPKLDVWREQATATYWAACREITDAGLWPSDPTEAQRLLDFFLLEKVFYEVEYELTNRPAWLHVPLEGLWRILFRHGVVQP
jgi:maltose alpha-D-glucosyltransferase/alpha-amylase